MFYLYINRVLPEPPIVAISFAITSFGKFPGSFDRINVVAFVTGKYYMKVKSAGGTYHDGIYKYSVYFARMRIEEKFPRELVFW